MFKTRERSRGFGTTSCIDRAAAGPLRAAQYTPAELNVTHPSVVRGNVRVALHMPLKSVSMSRRDGRCVFRQRFTTVSVAGSLRPKHEKPGLQSLSRRHSCEQMPTGSSVARRKHCVCGHEQSGSPPHDCTRHSPLTASQYSPYVQLLISTQRRFTTSARRSQWPRPSGSTSVALQNSYSKQSPSL
jgi:hypothetical protein